VHLITHLRKLKVQVYLLICVCVVPSAGGPFNVTKGIQWVHSSLMGRDSSVGIATRYGLGGSGIECRWGGGGEIFRTRPDGGHNQPPI
jgi:hypothetical protein